MDQQEQGCKTYLCDHCERPISDPYLYVSHVPSCLGSHIDRHLSSFKRRRNQFIECGICYQRLSFRLQQRASLSGQTELRGAKYLGA